jgi:hypothetical protein
MATEFDIGSGTAQPSTGAEETPAVPHGVQQRFNELTATIHKQNETLTSLQQQLLETQRTAIQLAQRTEQATPAVNPLDAKLAALPEELRGPVMDVVQTAFNTYAMPIQQTQMEYEFNSIAAQYGLNEQEIRTARNLLADWNARRIPGRPQDAIGATIGVANLESRKATIARANQQVSGLPPSGSSPPPQQAPQPNQPAPVPDDIDNWPVNKQWEFWRKRAGVSS